MCNASLLRIAPAFETSQFMIQYLCHGVLVFALSENMIWPLRKLMDRALNAVDARVELVTHVVEDESTVELGPSAPGAPQGRGRRPCCRQCRPSCCWNPFCQFAHTCTVPAPAINRGMTMGASARKLDTYIFGRCGITSSRGNATRSPVARNNKATLWRFKKFTPEQVGRKPRCSKRSSTLPWLRGRTRKCTATCLRNWPLLKKRRHQKTL